MKHIHTLFIILVFSINSFAQDLIIAKNGTIIKGKVIEVGEVLVKYKKWENLDGPRYVILKADLNTIKYENGKVLSLITEVDSKAELVTTRLKQIKNYLLVIAVEDYTDKNINDLDHPVNDAKKVLNILTDKYTFEKEQVVFLENPDRASIIRAFDKLAKVVTTNDNLLIFYAGHGLWDSQMNKGYWLPRNAAKDDRSDWFSNSDLRDYIGGINSKHTLMVADACFSGSIFKTRDAFSKSPDTNGALELYKTTSRQAMTSGAMKSVPDKSVFIQYLCKKLEENQELFMSAEQLFHSFKIAVINNSPNGQIPQFGVIKETGDEGGDFLFIKK